MRASTPRLEPSGEGQDAVESTTLEQVLERAVISGVIDRSQADAIVAAEGRGPVTPRADGATRVRSLAAEALGYVGAVLAIVSVMLVAQRFWTDLRPWARVTLLAITSVGLLVAGAAARPGEASAPLRRLRSVLWFAATAAIAATVGVAAAELTELGPGAVALTVGTVTGGAALALWRRWPTALQQIAFAASAGVAALGGLDVLEVDLARYAGLPLWALGVAWLLLTWARVVEPVGAGYVVGGLTAIFGPFVATSDDQMRWLLVVGLVTAAAVVGASVLVRRTTLLAIGALGLFAYVPRLVFIFFGEALGPALALFVTGVVLIGLALGLTRVHGAGRPGGGP